MSDYGSTTNVAAYVKHMTNSSGVFDTTTKPTLADVTIFLDEVCAQLNGWLANCDYPVPVTNANAKLILDRYANLGAAGLCELTMRSAGYSKEDQNKRENKFLDEFYKAEAFICGGALLGLGVQTIAAGPELRGFMIGGRNAGGQAARPIFRRTMFNNDPAAENNGNKEAPYSSEI
jgi:hypothetical protein